MDTIRIYFLGIDFEVSKAIAKRLKLKDGQVIKTYDKFNEITAEQFYHSILIVKAQLTNKNN